MSDDSNEAVTSCCASCGVAESDDIKLKKCNGCHLVKYCGVECQKAHRKQHKRDCKKRAAELRDELLFKQPESSHLGDCPICCLPLSLDMAKFSMTGCCSKMICRGCVYTNFKQEEEARRDKKCPFCREPMAKTKEAARKMRLKRVEVNDPVALCQEGSHHQSKGDYVRAFNYYMKAAELGDAWAHYELSMMYRDGLGVERDEGKQNQHGEEAAIGGHPDARHNLGCVEWSKLNDDRAVKHFIIAATQGQDDSIKALMKVFKEGIVSKDELTAALRAHKAAIDATKSPQREEAEKFYREWDWEGSPIFKNLG